MWHITFKNVFKNNLLNGQTIYYLNADDQKLIDGTYKVYVYEGPQLIGTSTFNLD